MKKTLNKIWDITVFTFLYSLLGVSLILFLSFVSMFIPFNPKSYDKIATQAAELFGIEENEYTFQFTTDLSGSWWSGIGGYAESNFTNGDWKGTNVYIRKGMPRNVTIYSIFHEFAHVAQAKYIIDKDLDDDSFYKNIEKQAGEKAFKVMIKNGYWWECFQLIYWNWSYVLMGRFDYIFMGFITH